MIFSFMDSFRMSDINWYTNTDKGESIWNMKSSGDPSLQLTLL